ncbi:AzlD domain-containing protein [Aeromicrobium sp. CF4.19]|uniref:AzlD domain-containing protein n=1 Tax=Aeromicrobium sp. CF4.19 TaxID=3373082 RepID=UPI003EE641D4
MSTPTTWLVIVTIAVGGFALRGAFILLPIVPHTMPPRVNLVLDMVPAAAFAALVAPAILLDDGVMAPLSPATLAGAITIIVSLRWGSMALSIACGLSAYACLDLVL